MTQVEKVYGSFISRTLRAALERAVRWHETATPEEKERMYAAQRESWKRAFGPCEHGEYDWETCPECLSSVHRQGDRAVELGKGR